MRVYVSGGTGFERCVRICPVLSSNLGWDLGLEGKAIPSISRQLEAILKGGREKYNREELWGGRGFCCGILKTIWYNHTMNKLIPWIPSAWNPSRTCRV